MRVLVYSINELYPYHEPNLIAKWSKVLPLNVQCLSPLPGFIPQSDVCEKIASESGLDDGFCEVLHFPQ